MEESNLLKIQITSFFYLIICKPIDYNIYSMIYFYTNIDLTIDWQLAFHQLNLKYQQLSVDHLKAIQRRDLLKQKILSLSHQNQQIKLKTQKKEFQTHQKVTIPSFSSLPPIQQQITIKPHKKNHSIIKKQSSTQTQTKPNPHIYQCTYEGCKRIYSSSVSMNLHIKIKHNGGTKKQRQAYARMFLQAEQRGEQLPQININLPPNFLQEYKTSYDYMKKYSM